MSRKAKENVKDTAVKTKETAAKAKEAVVETAAKAKEAVAETAVKAKEAVAETAAKAKETTAKAKEAVASKTAAAKTTSKKASKDSCYVEFSNKQFSTEELIENAKLSWKASHEGTISDIKVYVNVDESKVYYVVNGVAAGDFQI